MNTSAPATTFSDSLKQIVQEFSKAAVNFHQRQDQVNLRDAMQVRKFNDQLMLLERAFLDPSGVPNYWEKKHIILSKCNNLKRFV